MEDDEDTIVRRCTLCGARASVDAAIVRAGVDHLTLVATYRRPRFSTAAVEEVKVILRAGQQTVRGEGHSREEAIAEALAALGISV